MTTGEPTTTGVPTVPVSGRPVDREAVRAKAARFELHDPAIQDDPYPLYRELREAFPIAWSEQHGGHWVVTSHEHAVSILQNPTQFSNAQVLIPNWEFPLGKQLPLEADGEEHRLYRQALADLFNPRVVNGIEPLMRQTAAELAREFVARGGGDLYEEYIAPLISASFAHSFDLPTAVLPDLLRFKDLLVHGGSSSRSAAPTVRSGTTS
jgi:cytochrome P450